MKLNRKLVLILALVLSVAMATTGTLAFLTDRDSETNIFTVGNVDIDLTEDFEQGATLLPGEKIEKKPVITNTGKHDAWVWMTVAIPAGMEDASADASKNLLHWNWLGGTAVGGNHSEAKIQEYIDKGYLSNELSAAEYVARIDNGDVWYLDGVNPEFTQVIDGVNYNVYLFKYKTPLVPGETTLPSFHQVYMDTHIDVKPNGDLFWVENGEVKDMGYNLNTMGNPKVYVAAYGIQADGFGDVEAAYAAYGEQWGSYNAAYAEPLVVNSMADLYAALDAGETDIVVKNAAITENQFNGHYYKDRNVDFVDCTITANMNYMYINDASYTNCTFDSGSANAAVHYDELFGDLVFNKCTFKTGKVQIGANSTMTGTVTFNDCTFEETTETSIWSEKGIRVYSPAEFNNCEFNNRVVMAGSNGLSIVFDDCTMNNGTPVYYVDNTDGIIRGGNIPAVTVK